MGQVCSLAREEVKDGAFVVSNDNPSESCSTSTKAAVSLAEITILNQQSSSNDHGAAIGDGDDDVSLSLPSIFKPPLCKEESTATFVSDSTTSSAQSQHSYYDGHASNNSASSSVIRSLQHPPNDTDNDENNAIHEYILKPRKPSQKGGVAWQEDPTGQTWLHHGRHWPRDFAILRGRVVYYVQQGRTKPWLLVTHVKQTGKGQTWKSAPRGAAMPFFYKQTHCLVLKQQHAPKELEQLLYDGNNSSSSSLGLGAAGEEGSSSLVLRMKQHRERSTKHLTPNNNTTSKSKSNHQKKNRSSKRSNKAVRFSQS